VARKVFICGKLGTLNSQDICKMVVSEFQDHATPRHVIASLPMRAGYAVPGL
jgi:hypothetical protein